MNLKTISIREVEYYMSQPDTWLIDLRSREEYHQYHIEGSRNIPYEELNGYLANMPEYITYILYCERGSASLMAAKQMAKLGYRVFTVVGGLQSWDRQELY
jgi:rhodanese-related sulfurtransferase